MDAGDSSAQAMQQSLDRGVHILAALEQTALKHARLITFQNGIMIALLLAMVALTGVLAIYTRALIGCY